MSKPKRVFLNDRLVPENEAVVPIMSHSLSRGSAIFEVLSLHQTSAGPAVFRLDEHLKRLFHTADLLSMALPLTPTQFRNAITATVAANEIAEGSVKIIGFYPQITSHILPPEKRLDIAIFVIDQPMDWPEAGGVTLGLARWRKLDPRTVPIEAKVAANYLNGMMARREAADRGFDYAVMLDADGFLAEGSTESVFIVREGCVMTPALGTILDSITRRSILEICREKGIITREDLLPPACLEKADEIFLAGTPHKIVPVRQVENRLLTPVPGPVSRVLGQALADILGGRDPEFHHWFSPLPT